MLWFVSGCTVKHHLSPGHYKENAGGDTALFQSEELILGYDNSFQYIFNNDDLGDSRYGSGTYRQENNQLILIFDGARYPTSYAESISREANDDTVIYNFEILSDEKYGVIPIGGVNIFIHGREKRLLTGIVSNEAGQARLALPKASAPGFLRMEFIGFDPVEQRIKPINSDFKIFLKPNYGQIIERGIISKYDIISVKANQIRLKKNSKTKAFRKIKSVDAIP